jgi:nitrogen fixation protein FixH
MGDVAMMFFGAIIAIAVAWANNCIRDTFDEKGPFYD